jgi:Rha family phage regulatory protein
MSDLSEFVTLSDTTLTTDSKRVAKHFNKRHADVLRAIESLECSAAYRERNFALTMGDVPGPKGAVRQEPLHLMTKDGFVFLVMGFRGAKAAAIKEQYIEAFNAMADQLQQIGMSLWDKRLELEKRDATSFMWASFGSKRMLERRRELPNIKETRDRLDHEMQPSLLGAAKETA